MFKKLSLKSYTQIMAPFTKMIKQFEASIDTRSEIITGIESKINDLHKSRAEQQVEILLARTGLSNVKKIIETGGLKNVE